MLVVDSGAYIVHPGPAPSPTKAEPKGSSTEGFRFISIVDKPLLKSTILYRTRVMRLALPKELQRKCVPVVVKHMKLGRVHIDESSSTPYVIVVILPI